MKLRISTLFIAVVALTLSSTAWAEDQNFQSAHWAYSSFFGTGWYRVDDNRSVFILRLPPRYTVRESSISESGERTFGLEIHYPVTFGLHNIDDIPGLLEPDNFGTFSFTPGVELEIPVTKQFYLRPFVDIGWGTELDSSEDAWIWHTGLKGRYTFNTMGMDMALFGGIYAAGYSPDTGSSQSIGAGMVGIEMTEQLDWTFFGNEMDFKMHFNYQHLTEELEYIDEFSQEGVGSVMEFGIAWKYRSGPIGLGLFNLQQVGLSYQFSPDGRYTAIKLNMRSWFTR